VDHDDAPLWVRTIDDVIENEEAPRFTRCLLSTELNFTTAEEPTMFNEAEKDVA
jgi:hypothetical protein